MSKLCPQPFSDRGIWKAVIVNSFYRVPTLFKQKNPQLFKIILKKKSHIQIKQISIRQSQFIEKGFKKTENSVQNMVLVLFLFTLQN